MRIYFILFSLSVIFLDSGLYSQALKESITASGFKIVWYESGEGFIAEPGNRVFFHVQYAIDDSILFDSRSRGEISSIDLPALSDPQIAGEPLFEALYLMVPGDVATVYQTLDQMNYVVPGMDSSELFQTRIVFLQFKTAEEHEIELQTIRNRETVVREFVEKVWWNFVSGEYVDQLIKTESGLQYLIHHKGNGPDINLGDRVRIHYFGKIIESARNFDNSFVRAQELSLEVGSGTMIAGWNEILPLLAKGDIVSVFIPYHLAYGERGRPPLVPGKSDLMFYIEILE